nr:hypothetical protein [uncultured Leptotrichia sp.]
MKKIFLIMSLVMAFSCGNKNKSSVDKNKKIEKNTVAEQVKQNQEEKTDFDKLSKKEQEEYLQKLEKIEAKYEKELMELKIPEFNKSQTNDSKQLTEEEVKEIKDVLRKKFKRIGLTAATKDGRFYIIEVITDGKNKEQTAKEVALQRPDIIDTIGKWCKNKGMEFKVIFVEFYDKVQKKKISQSAYHSHLLEIQYEDKEYKDALREGFSKYKRATKF